MVDLACIGTFGAGQHTVDPHDLLFADLQINQGAHIFGRLGSGRSGTYRDWYLKGIGRTPLAANWHLEDHLHNTGHQAASSAIREYVISQYLRQLGVEDSIVPCVGVLLAELQPALRRFQSLLYRDAPPEFLPAVDQHLQAITVKRADFSRASNFAWLLHHLTPFYINDGKTSLAILARLWTLGLSSETSPESVGAVDPAGMAALLQEALQRGCRNFRSWWQAGVWWGSFRNNFTLDGRFLDLETPNVSGGPLFGVLRSKGLSAAAPVKSETLGLGIFQYFAQMRWFCETLVQVSGSLPPPFTQSERQFGARFAREIQETILCPDNLLVSKTRALEYVLDMLLEDIDGGSGTFQAEVESLLASEYDRRFLPVGSAEQMRPPAVVPRLVPVEGIPPVISEPGLAWRFHAFQFTEGRSIEPSAAARRRGRRVNEWIAELDATTDLDLLLGKLAETEERIAAIVHEEPDLD